MKFVSQGLGKFLQPYVSIEYVVGNMIIFHCKGLGGLGMIKWSFAWKIIDCLNISFLMLRKLVRRKM